MMDVEFENMVEELESTLGKQEDSKIQTINSSSSSSCSHPGFLGDICITCGDPVYDKSGTRPFNFLLDGLSLRTEEVTRLCDLDFPNMIRQKKLHLILDLDHTLIHSTDVRSLPPEEMYLSEGPWYHARDFSKAKGTLFRVRTRLFKLRPFVRTFLSEANKLFCLSIGTYAGREYALEVAKILDPDGSYFGSRIVSNGDSVVRKRKRLDAVLGHDRLVLVLDDVEEFWDPHKENLIRVDPYWFFSYLSTKGPNKSTSKSRPRPKSLASRKLDEDEANGVLANALRVLTQVHGMFYDPKRKDDFASRDVRQELAKIRSEVLTGCNIVIPRAYTYVREIALKLGAKCWELGSKRDPSITHFISRFGEGYIANSWGIQKGKILVISPEWLVACYNANKRLPEEKFLLCPPTLLPFDAHHAKRLTKLLGFRLSLRIKIFIWRAISDLLPTKKKLANKCNIGDGLCSICGLGKESALHLFFYCKIAKMVWIHRWNIEPEKYKFSGVCDWFDSISSPCKSNWCKKEEEEAFIEFAFTLSYKIWGIRNYLRCQGCIQQDPSSSSYLFNPSNFDYDLEFNDLYLLL